MRIFKSMLIAFSMYSRIPVKGVEWNEDNMRFCLCFVPVIGLVTGALNYIIWYICKVTEAPEIFFGCVAAVMPIIITGGIHMDGFCDTVDAVASYRTREKRLEILKDPHAGAFAIIGVCCYFILSVGSLGSVRRNDTMLIIMLTYVLSRCTGCFCAVVMKNARNEGTLFTFTGSADRNNVAAIIVFTAIITSCGMVMINTLTGMLSLLGMAAAAAYAVIMAGTRFGGVTGDIIGYTIQVTELSGIIMAVLGELIWNLL